MKYFIANFKQNFDSEQFQSWLHTFHPQLPPETQVILAPPLPFLPLGSDFSFKLAAQSVSTHQDGANTGQVGAHQLKGLVDYCIIGHSEVRKELGLTDQQITAQAKLLRNEGIVPIVCLDTPYLESQITSLKRELLDLPELIIAYEPLAAIGSGRPDTAAHANEIAFKIKHLTRLTTPVIYGGSTTPDNAPDFLKQEYLDGLLVGKSCLNPLDFSLYFGK